MALLRLFTKPVIAGNTLTGNAPAATESGAGVSFFRAVLGYLGIATVCCAILFAVNLFWKLDLSAPFCYKSDGLYHLNYIKNIQDTGWYLSNHRFGAPGGQDFHEYPATDGLDSGIMYAWSLIVDDPAGIYNFFYLTTFPLTAIFSLFVLQRLGVSYLPASIISLLYTFMPYHGWRVIHLFMAGYYLVPLSVLLAVRLFQDKPFLARENDSRDWRFWDVVGAGCICLLIGFGAIYYAVFSCFFFMVAGIGGWIRHQKSRILMRAVGLAAVIFSVFLFSKLPGLMVAMSEGANAEFGRRNPVDTELSGLKIIHLLLPVRDHRVGFLSRFEQDYCTELSANCMAALGLTASIGFLYLLCRFLFRSQSSDRKILDALSVFSVASLLLSTIGGFGTLFAFTVSPWIRGYERISIFLGFFGLVAVALGLQRLMQNWSTTTLQRLGFATLAIAIGVLGVLDQTPVKPTYMDRSSATYQRDREFVRAIEQRVPPGKIILQLPYRYFPEPPLEPPGIAFESYDLLRPAIHSKTLRWTHGSIHGSPTDRWRVRLDSMPLEHQLETIAQAEFGGVYVDRNAYRDQGESLVKDLTKRLGPATVVSDDGRMLFFDLASYVEQRRRQHSESEWAHLREQALNPLLICWRTGFQGDEKDAETGNTFRWGDRKSAIMVVNGMSTTREARIAMKFDVPYQNQQYRLRITSDLFADEIVVGKEATTLEKTIQVPQGKHLIHFECNGPRMHRTGSPGNPVVFRALKCEITETPRQKGDVEVVTRRAP